jgi:hypothetical protein
MKPRCALLAVLMAVGFPAAAIAQSANSVYSIAGTVVDSVTSNPVRRAELSIILNREEVSAFSDESGHFRFDHLQPGKYQLYASAFGYVRQGLNQHGAFFTGVVTGNGLDSEHIIFRLHPQALIHGKVTDQNGEPVRNASVHLFAIPKRLGQLPSMQGQQQTNDLGEYRFAHLLAGKYYVAVQAQPWYAQSGFNYVPVETETANFRAFSRRRPGKLDPALDVVYPVTFYPGVADERSASEVSVSEGETAEANIPISAVPAVHIRLTNLPADTPPSINIFRKVFGSFPIGTGVQTMQIAPGELEITGLPPGEITLTVINPGSTGQSERTLEANLTGSDTLDAAKPLPTATVSGRVLLPAGSLPIADAAVILLKDGGPGSFGRLTKDGTFTLGSVPLGSYRILVNLLREPKYIQKVSASGAKVSGRDLHIAATNDVELTIVMGGGLGTVTGMAMLNDRGIDGVMVLLVPESGTNLDEDAHMDQSDSDGSFQLAGIVPGKYRLLAIQNGWGLDWRDPAVLKPYLEKAELLEISASETRKITVQVQKRIGSPAAVN